jgi:hypothetical protein
MIRIIMQLNDKQRMSSRFFTIADEEWPLARITMTRDPLDSDEFDEFVAVCKDNLYGQKRGAFVLLVDPRGLTEVNVTYLYKIVAFMREMEPLTKRFMIELGVLVESSVIRHIIDWIQLVRTPAVPWIIFSTPGEIGEWLEHLEDRQILFPRS